MILRKQIIISAVIMLLVGCNYRVPGTLFPHDVELQSGDIVLRCGSGITSRAVLYADNGGNYSHVGIVVELSGKMMIVHAVPDEHDAPNEEDRVKMDSPEMFFSALRTNNGCIMRYHDSLKAAKAAQEAYRICEKGVLFDHDYNDLDSSKMYCCELVEYAYKKVGVSIVGDERHDVNLPIFAFEHIILPSDFLKSNQLKIIKVF